MWLQSWVRQIHQYCNTWSILHCMTSCHSRPGMRLNGFLHPGTTSTSRHPQNDLDSLYLDSQPVVLFHSVFQQILVGMHSDSHCSRTWPHKFLGSNKDHWSKGSWRFWEFLQDAFVAWFSSVSLLRSTKSNADSNLTVTPIEYPVCRVSDQGWWFK